MRGEGIWWCGSSARRVGRRCGRCLGSFALGRGLGGCRLRWWGILGTRATSSFCNLSNIKEDLNYQR